MSRHILVIHENPDLAKMAGRAVKRAFGSSELTLIRTSNFEDARENLEEGREHEWPLIVTGATVPESARSGATPGNYDALFDFLAAVRSGHKMRMPVMVILEDSKLAERLAKWNVIPVDCHLGELETKARALHMKTPVETSLEIVLTLKEDNDANWLIRRKGMQEFEQTGRFKIDGPTFDSLVTLSRSAGKCTGKELSAALKALGYHLDNMLFQRGSAELQKKLFKHIGSVGIEHSRIRFTMTPSRHCAMVEALREGDGDPIDNYWMLTTPIVRQYEFEGGRRPLYVDAHSRDKSVRCLIINADPAQGDIESGAYAGRYAALDSIRGEADDIAEFLDTVGQTAHIEEIQRVDLSEDPGRAQQTLRDMLKKDWHIVHFAGHGVLGTDGEPALILSAAKNQVYRFKDLALELKEAQFIYLSACHSSDPEFLDRAIKCAIPEVIGYMWEVDDLDAAGFAGSFYRNLFDHNGSTYKMLDHSLVATRKSAFVANPGSRIWASPVLLTQARGSFD